MTIPIFDSRPLFGGMGLAIPIKYRPLAGGERIIMGIHTTWTPGPSIAGEAGFTGFEAPRSLFILQIDDVTDIEEDAELEAGDQVWAVREIEPDNIGCIRVLGELKE